MKPLDPPAQVTRVLSFDFDGTLHDPAGEPPVARDLFDLLAGLRESHGAVWGINTGRSMDHVVEGLVDGRFPFSPDWVVARERELWFPNAVGRWVAEEKWNKACEKEHHRFFRKIRKLMERIRHEVEEHTGAQWVEQAGDPAGLIARTEEEMEWIVGRVRELAADQPLLGWMRNSIYLRFGHKNYHKGSSLGAVAGRYGLGPADCFAIGDSHNDLEMLSPDAAAEFACPSNAVPEVRSHVEALGGYLCVKGHSEGCVEALERAYPMG